MISPDTGEQSVSITRQNTENKTAKNGPSEMRNCVLVASSSMRAVWHSALVANCGRQRLSIRTCLDARPMKVTDPSSSGRNPLLELQQLNTLRHSSIRL